MSLPKLNAPTFFLTIPSNKKNVKFRPFLVKEEKILLLVKESNNPEEILNAMEEIIDVCTFKQLNVSTLPIFDLEYMFMQLRGKSVGEVIEIAMRCLNEVDNERAVDDEPLKKPCNHKLEFKINIEDIKVHTPENHKNTFILDKENGIGITFKYPCINKLKETEKTAEEGTEDNIDTIIDLVDNIFDKDNVYEAKDIPKAEIKDFIESMTKSQFEMIIRDFFDSMPVISYTKKYKCPGCGYEGEYTFRGIVDFF